MKIALIAVFDLLLVLALLPEFNRYGGEHSLYRVTALFQAMLHGEAAENRSAVYERAVALAASATESLPGDSRPVIVEGSLRLFARQPAEALAMYRQALDIGERPEVDLNLGRAYEMLGDHPAASAAILRAAWISPAIISELPDNLREPVQNAIAQEEELLRHRRLSAPPALPANTSQ